jgi:hypothetical protein
MDLLSSKPFINPGNTPRGKMALIAEGGGQPLIGVIRNKWVKYLDQWLKRHLRKPSP